MSLESTFKRKTMKRKAWAGWSGWIQVSEVICGKRIAARVKVERFTRWYLRLVSICGH